MKKSTLLKTLAVTGAVLLGGEKIANATDADIFEAFKNRNNKAISIGEQGQKTSTALVQNFEGFGGPDPKLNDDINIIIKDPIGFSIDNTNKYFPDPKVSALINTIKSKIDPREKEALNKIYAKLISGYKTEKEAIIFIISTLESDVLNIGTWFSDTYRNDPTDLDMANFEEFQYEYNKWLEGYNNQLTNENNQLTNENNQLTNENNQLTNENNQLNEISNNNTKNLINELNKTTIYEVKNNKNIYEFVKNCKELYEEDKSKGKNTRTINNHIVQLFAAL